MEARHSTVQPVKRWIENGHIFLWLIKDTCWALEWKVLACCMIVPTLSVALYLTFKSRRLRGELIHCTAVTLWIIANSIWMIGEFRDVDTRVYAAALFALGLLMLVGYYVLYFRKDVKAEGYYALVPDDQKAEIQ